MDKFVFNINMSDMNMNLLFCTELICEKIA